MLLHFGLNLIIFIITLGILIIVHESGHFLAACLFKIKIERFSIGFGPVLWKWYDKNGTEYSISSILLGGYVKLYSPQNHIVPSYNQSYNIFEYQHIWKRSFIILAGPISNFLFSVLLYIIIIIMGVPTYKPIIHSILPNSVVAQSGLSSGVEIKSINNIPTDNWESVYLQLYNNINQEKIIITTAPLNNGCVTKHTIQLIHCNKIHQKNNIYDPVKTLGIIPENLCMTPIISKIKPNSISEQSGLKIGDKILSVNKQPIYDWESFIKTIKNNYKDKIKILVKRDTQILNFNLVSFQNNITSYYAIEDIIGAYPTIITLPVVYYIVHWYELHLITINAIYKTWQLIVVITNALFQLISGDIEMINLGGPLLIAQEAVKSAQSGIIYFLMFLALISINLGVINLFPMPILDGGHLLFLLIETIKGQPISKHTQDIAYNIGLVILILIMCIAFFNDISRLK